MDEVPELSEEEVNKLRDALIGDSIMEIEMLNSERWPHTRARLDRWQKAIAKIQAELNDDNMVLLNVGIVEKLDADLATIADKIKDVRARYPKSKNKWQGVVIEMAMVAYLEERYGTVDIPNNIPKAAFTYYRDGAPSSQGAFLVQRVWDDVLSYFAAIDSRKINDKEFRQTIEAVQKARKADFGEHEFGSLQKAKVRIVNKWKKSGKIPQLHEISVLTGDDDTWISV